MLLSRKCQRTCTRKAGIEPALLAGLRFGLYLPYTFPNSSQLLPLNFISCSRSIG